MMYSKTKISAKQIRTLLKPLLLLVVFASSFLSVNYALAEEPSNFSNSATEVVSPSNFYTVQDVGQEKQKIHPLDNEQGSKIRQATLSGSGTEGDPYQIQSIIDLQTLRNDASYYDKHFILMQDLNFTSADYEDTSTGWKPIGNSTHLFSGSFNGNYKIIQNLFCNRTANHAGLFGYSNGIISNIRLESVAITGNNTVGGLIGYNEATITNSLVSGTVNGSYSVGGLIGLNNGTITNSSASGDVSGNFYVGGLIGYNEATITNSLVSGTVNGSYGVGGLVGFNNGTITNSSASGTVNGSYSVGGLAGLNFGTITNSSASGDVSGDNSVGGLAGFNVGTITNSSAFGDVSGGDNVGGLAGYNSRIIGIKNHATITNSSASGNVSGGDNVGGLVGFNNDIITSSSASGDVSGNDNVGGLVGYNNDIITSSSASGNVCGTDDIGGLVGGNSGGVSRLHYFLGKFVMQLIQL